MKTEDLVVGVVYTWLFPEFCTWTGEFNSVSKLFADIRTGIHYKHSNSGKSALGRGAITWNHELDWIRLATPQEKEHLNQCIQAGKYVDYKPSNKIVYGYQIL